MGSEDSNGRAIWALGVTARDGKDAKHRDWARTMFDRTASLALELGSLRAQSFAMLGAAAMLETSPGHELARSILQRFPTITSHCWRRAPPGMALVRDRAGL